MLKVFGTGYWGDRGPVVYGPVGISAAAMWRIKVASGQAAAKARRTREAISTTRAPSFKSRRRMVLNSAVASACAFRDCTTQGEYQPVRGGVQDQPHLVGERAAAAGAIGGKLRFV